jgi:hypothetical protein
LILLGLPRININASDGSVVAVAVGAFLATISGFIGNQIEHYNRRRDNERSAALLFGEILVGIRFALKLADEMRGRGDPYGPITMRMVRAAQRETQTYDRNRESLFDLRDPQMRAQIHILLVRLILALEGIAETSREIATTEATMRLRGQADDSYKEFAAVRDSHSEDRARSFDFTVGLTTEIGPLLEKLQRIAKYSFDEHEAVMRQSVAPG